MESPPVTLELLKTVGRKLKRSLTSPKTTSLTPPPIQSEISQMSADLSTDILRLLNPHEPPAEWKKSVAMLRQKGPYKPFIGDKIPTKSLENAIRQRRVSDVTQFTIEQSTSTGVSLPVLKPSLLIRLKGSLTPSDYLTAEKKSLAIAAAAINNSLDKEVKKALEVFEETSFNSPTEPKAEKAPFSRLLTKLRESPSSPNDPRASPDAYFPSKVTQEPTTKSLPFNRHITHGSARPIIRPLKSVVSHEHRFGDTSNNARTALNDLTGLDLEEYPNGKSIYTGSSFVHQPVSTFVDHEFASNSAISQKKNLYGEAHQIVGSVDKAQVYDELTVGEVITKRDVVSLEKKRDAQEDVTGLDSFVSWRRRNKEHDGTSVVTEALKVDNTSIKFFPTMLSELTANYSKDLVDNINKAH
ncbi:Hypothetical protein GLP15_3094 [Giardia lamblia P15]|uniref:Uncharacterized protein n=1 Tax=Giardia intestinalis (strain P15) TaxID=658858 RepID=E1F2T7_GIAIA|nr:Hypothetical protein GLP15_3094 [Giardia lamblia P15]